MSDPKMEGAPILRDTGCTVGGHIVVQTGTQFSAPSERARCNCGAYTLAELRPSEGRAG